MNGFYTNTDVWYFEIFGYNRLERNSFMNHLTEFDVVYPYKIELMGMEKLQGIYRNHQNQIGKEICDLLILYRFLNLIQQTQSLIKRDIFMVVSAHDFDIFYTS